LGLKAKDPSKGCGPWHPPQGVKSKCLPTDTCSQLNGKIYVSKKMIKSHEGWDRSVPRPRGGNRHTKEIADLWNGYARCQNFKRIKKCGNCRCH